MGRRRSFDEDTLLAAAASSFVIAGYEATSIDDLVTRLGVHRGSLYNAFGSKRGLFLKALVAHVETRIRPLTGVTDHEARQALRDDDALDLVMVAAVERGPVDVEVATTVRTALDLVEHALTGRRPPLDQEPTAALAALGARLYARLAAVAPTTSHGEDT